MPAAPREPFRLDRGLASTTRLHDGVEMPVLGLGVWKSAPGRETREAVASALAAGYRLVDTAAMYGNEADVGEAVRTSGISRDEIFITTKVWNSDQGFEPTLRAFERSERALGLGPIDLYLVHWPVPEKRLETWKGLEKLRREGRCRSIGVSNFTDRHLDELAARSSTVPTVNQVEFNPFLFQSGLLERCGSAGIQLEAWAPLGRAHGFQEPTLTAIAADHGTSPAPVLVRWGLQHGVVQIPKSVRAERIRENAAVFDFALTQDEMRRLDALHRGTRSGWDPSEMA